jgi:hypothetical protein
VEIAATDPITIDEKTAAKVQPKSPHKRAFVELSMVNWAIPKGLPTKLGSIQPVRAPHSQQPKATITNSKC